MYRYFVELEDTILFPEGGGQPDDHGTINDVEVERVIRKGKKVSVQYCDKFLFFQKDFAVFVYKPEP